MDPQKEEKTFKYAKWFAFIILVLNLISFIVSIGNGQMTTLAIVIRCALFAILLASIFGYANRKKYGPICGIIVSILIILNLDIFDILIGIAYLYDNISLLKYLKE